MATEKRRNMVLHFDLNRPVIMSDAAGVVARSVAVPTNLFSGLRCSLDGFGATLSLVSACKRVVQELDLLVDGHHLIGLPTMADHFRLKLQPSARCATTFYRDGFEADDTALALGTLIKSIQETPEVERAFATITELKLIHSLFKMYTV
ncbi:unnamed protein product [Peronospora farinosa]|uniref:Uncharacterized protein n=1 Tax=Peronospora farinosa TaxID=134698 RepID=A0ABN8CFU8_9STRA|nr:unnamed protein product [Peronospora farinosa]